MPRHPALERVAHLARGREDDAERGQLLRVRVRVRVKVRVRVGVGVGVRVTVRVTSASCGQKAAAICRSQPSWFRLSPTDENWTTRSEPRHALSSTPSSRLRSRACPHRRIGG